MGPIGETVGARSHFASRARRCNAFELEIVQSPTQFVRARDRPFSSRDSSRPRCHFPKRNYSGNHFSEKVGPPRALWLAFAKGKPSSCFTRIQEIKITLKRSQRTLAARRRRRPLTSLDLDVFRRTFKKRARQETRLFETFLGHSLCARRCTRVRGCTRGCSLFRKSFSLER